MNGEKKEKKKVIYILQWSMEDIKIYNEELKLIIRSEAPGADIRIVNLLELKKMGVKAFKDFWTFFQKNVYSLSVPQRK